MSVSTDVARGARSSKLSQYGDALERTLWTAAEGAGAVGLVAGYQALPLPDVPPGYVVLLTVAVGALLAAGKGIIATNVGNGSASLGLPVDIEPVPAASVEATIARATGTQQLDPAEVDLDGDGHDDRTGRFTKH
jgi:hypothetical protein